MYQPNLYAGRNPNANQQSDNSGLQDLVDGLLPSLKGNIHVAEIYIIPGEKFPWDAPGKHDPDAPRYKRDRPVPPSRKPKIPYREIPNPWEIPNQPPVDRPHVD